MSDDDQTLSDLSAVPDPFAPPALDFVPNPVPQIERYTPPAAMYDAPADLYVPVTAQQEESVEETTSAESEPEEAPVEEPVTATQTAQRSTRLTIQTMDLHTAGEPLRSSAAASPTCR